MSSRLLAVFGLSACLTSPLLAADPTTAPSTSTAPTPHPHVVPPADKPAIKPNNPAFLKRHDEYLALAKKGGIDLYFVGDSITDNWHSAGKKVWDAAFAGWNPGNFGIGGDRTEHVLWRLQNGELDGVSPKAFVVMIGTNNVLTSRPEQVAAGVEAILKTIQDKNPHAKILLLAIFPRGATPTDPRRLANDAANKIIATFDDGKNVKYLDIGAKFLAEDGTLPKTIMPDLLHPNAKGYQIEVDAITPTLTEWLGPKPATAPAPK